MLDKKLIYNDKFSRFCVLGGLLLSVSVSLLKGTDQLLINPLIGLIISFGLLAISFIMQSSIVIRLMLSYLVAILVNQSMLKSFELSSGDLHVTLFWHFPILLLFLLGFIGVSKRNLEQLRELFTHFGIGLVVILVYMALLFIILNNTFGFGYEKDTGIIANLVVFSVFLSGLTVFLNDKKLFKGVSVILIIYFGVMNVFG